MSTIYVFQQEVPALGAVPASDDVFLVYDTSAGRTKSVTGAQIGDQARGVTAATTSAAISGFGITVASTLLSANALTAPTQAGQEVSILFPNSTAVHTVTPAGATILGSTISPSGATVLTVTGTSLGVSAAATLIASSTSQWYLKSFAGPVVTS